MGGNHGSRWWPLRVFKVVENSMRPALKPGDLLLALRGGMPRRGQLRVFRHPHQSTRWCVKRVDEVYRGERSVIFEARSDNAGARGASDSNDFGWVPAAGSYRVVWTLANRASRND